MEKTSQNINYFYWDFKFYYITIKNNADNLNETSNNALDIENLLPGSGM